MTVIELRDELNKLIDFGHAETRVIAQCYSKYTFASDGEEAVDMPFLYCHKVYYQSGDIELEFDNDQFVD